MNLKDTAKRKINILIQLTWPLFFLIMSGFGDGHSMAYLAVSVEGTLIFLLLFMQGMPYALERLMHSRISKGQLRNAGKIFHISVLITVVFVLVISAVLYGISEGYAVSVLHMPFAVLTLRILIVFFALAALILLLQGFFQGTGSYMPTVLSGAGFALFMTGGGILFVILLGKYGQKVAALLQNAMASGMYVSAGAALGLAVAGVIPLLFLVVLYCGSGRRMMRQWKNDGFRKTEAAGSIGTMVLVSSCSASFILFANRLPVYLGMLFYQGATKGTESDLLGSYYSMVEMTGLFLVLLLSMGLIRCQNLIGTAIRRKELKGAREYFGAAMQWSLMTALFLPAFSMGGGTLISHMLCPDMQEQEVLFTLAGIGTAVFLLSILFVGIQHSTGQKRQVNLSLLAAIAVYIVFVLAGLKLTQNHIYVLPVGRIVFGLVVCGMNGFYVSRQLRFQPEWVRMLIFPAASSAVTGLILFLLKKALYTYLGDVLMFFVSLILGIICYTVLLMVLKSIRKKELRLMPGGQILEKIGSILHLL